MRREAQVAELQREVLGLGLVAGTMEQAAEQADPHHTPGRVCMAALMVAAVNARRAGLSLRLLVSLLRGALA